MPAYYFYILVFILLLIVLIFFRRKKKEPIIIVNNEIKITDEFKEILNFLENSKENLFISGKAGTGKSTLLNHFCSNTSKKYVILAPTGVAALNVKGKTIHSFFQFPPGILEPKDIKNITRQKELFRNLDMVIIDEISMVSSNLIGAIDYALRINTDNIDKHFGGVQMVFIGDLFQLPPVAEKNLKDYFEKKYGSEYFFDGLVFKKDFKYKFAELTYIFRQNDEEFKKLLNRFRNNSASREDFIALNKRYVKNTGNYAKDAVFLTTKRNIARQFNEEKLKAIKKKEFKFEAILTGKLKEKYDKIISDFNTKLISEDEFEKKLENNFPTDIILRLKKNAQVLMIKNDSAKRWVNGSIGKISKINKNDIWIEIENVVYKVEKETWENVKYKYDIVREQLTKASDGSFMQFPIKLAYALTIHKSQGRTFKNIVIDVGTGAFAHGQTYVALSRCTTFEGIILNQEIQPSDIITDEKIIQYYNSLTNDTQRKSPQCN